MSITLGNITLEHITDIAVIERIRTVNNEIPGMDGSLTQVIGRPSVEVKIKGCFYSNNAAEELAELRNIFLKKEPVQFFAEAVGEGYFSKVLITGLQIYQKAESTVVFDYDCYIREYIDPPEPLAANPFQELDTALAVEAATYIDKVESAMAIVKKATNMLKRFNFDLPTSFETIAYPFNEKVETMNEKVKPKNGKDGLMNENIIPVTPDSLTVQR